MTVAAVAAAPAIALGAGSPVDRAVEGMLRGVQAFLAYANAQGGVRGRRVEPALDAPPDEVVASLEELPPAAPPPRAEGEAYGRLLAATEPDATVAVLVGGDDR